ncbi:MAG: DegV family protein [Bacillota bacterium]
MLQIVTDSSCDLTDEQLEEHNITVVPLKVTIDGQEYFERVDLSPLEFYGRMAEALPRTSQPPPLAFAKIFNALSRKGEVLCLTISSKLSGTYQSACMGKEMSGGPVTVFDTLAGSLGHGLQVLKAAEMASAGFSVAKIVEKLKSYRDEMNILILLDTLENIVRGGRLSKFQGTLAKVLDIKVILEGVQGEVELREKIRGRKRFLNRALELIGERKQDFSRTVFGITHVNNMPDVDYLEQAIKERFKPAGVLVNYMGSVMSTYAGKNGMIISF